MKKFTFMNIDFSFLTYKYFIVNKVKLSFNSPGIYKKTYFKTVKKVYKTDHFILNLINNV